MGQLAHLFLAVRSPPATVEHEQDRLTTAKIAERHPLAATRDQRKVRRLRPEGDAMRGLLLGHTIHLHDLRFYTHDHCCRSTTNEATYVPRVDCHTPLRSTAIRLRAMTRHAILTLFGAKRPGW